MIDVLLQGSLLSNSGDFHPHGVDVLSVPLTKKYLYQYKIFFSLHTQSSMLTVCYGNIEVCTAQLIAIEN
jgi:hypothetical protein